MRIRNALKASVIVLFAPVAIQAEEVVDTTLIGVAWDGVIGLEDGTTGRLWGIDPAENFAPALWETFGEQPISCVLAGILNTTPAGIYSNLPVFVCWGNLEESADPVFLHQWAVDQGLARPICIEADVHFRDECG